MRSVFMRHKWEPYLWILPSVLLSMILMPPVYLLVKAVHKTGGSYDL